MPMTQREMVKLLSKNGFRKVKSQGKGSHVKMTKDGLFRPIEIPHGELPRGTERAILKQAGLT
jgi:predicted RNA binding protein YcfA (HicA-like mRNA interferase family)